MNDTDPRIASKMREMFARKSPAERVAMGCSMFDTSRRLVVSSLLRQTPDADAAFLRREIFLRFYGADFDPDRREKILEHLFTFHSPND